MAADMDFEKASELLTEAPTTSHDAPGAVAAERAPMRMGRVQRTAGNRAAARMVRVQPKLRVGAANDPHEREADSVADRVVRALQGNQVIETDAIEATDDDPGAARTVRRKAGTIGLEGGDLDEQSERTLRSEMSSGAPLDAVTRSTMEGAMGADLGGVRVHTGSTSTQLNETMNAEAFTVGSDIFFRGGAPDVGTASGQHLLAHELTHTIQQGGAQRSIDRKMWTVDKYKDATYEGFFTGSSEAQTVVVALIDEYIKKYEARGVVLPADYSKALNLLLQMKDTTRIWMSEHTVSVEADDGSVSTMDDPNRVKRMAGMRLFQSFLDNEIASMQQLQTNAGQEVTSDIEVKDPKYVKYTQRKEQASTMFQRIGTLADKMVTHDGDSTEIEVEFQFPIEPTGVGFIGGKFSASVERDDGMIKIGGTMAITGGADIEVASIKGELGMYVEAANKTGAAAMETISYAIYRRFRESNIVPAEASNWLWGGNWGAYGKAKAEKWSADLEKKYWGLEDPDPADYGTDAAGQAEYAKALKEVEDEKNKIYVETGGAVGVAVGVDAKVFEAEVGAEAKTGKRIDYTSLKNTKGGAGAKNKKATDMVTQAISSATGGARGAEASVGRTVRQFSISGSMGADIGVGSMKGEVSLGINFENDGAPGSKTEYSGVELEATWSAGLPFAELGPGTGRMIDMMTDKLVLFMRAASGKAEVEGGEAAAEAVNFYTTTILALNEAKVEAVEETVASAAGIELPGTETEVSIAFSLEKGSGEDAEGAVDFKRTKETGVDIPKILSAKVSNSRRYLKITRSGGAWVVS